jgi:hypothetical protein
MNGEQWKRNGSLSVVRHKPEPENDYRGLEKRLEDINLSDGRLRSFRGIIKPIAMVTMCSIFGAGCSAVQMSHEDFQRQALQVVAEEQKLDAAGVQDLQHEDYKYLQEIGGSDLLTIVDRSDPNVAKIFARAQDHLIPGAFGAESDEFKIKARKIISETVYNIANYPAAVKGPIPNHEESLCFMQVKGPDHLDANGLAPVFLNDAESKLFIASHEMAHCQDVRNLVGDNDRVLKMEILSDMTSALLVASQTGNWDLANKVIVPLRMMDWENKDHATAMWVEEMVNTTDLDKLEPMNQRDALKLAFRKFEAMDYGELTKKTTAHQTLMKTLESTGSGLPDTFENLLYIDKQNLARSTGINNDADFKAAREEVAKSVMVKYLNHIEYKGAEGHPSVPIGLNQMLVQFNYVFNPLDPGVSNAVQGIWEARGNGEPVDLSSIANNLGIDFQNQPESRLENNEEKVREITKAYLGEGKIPEMFKHQFGESMVKKVDLTSGAESSNSIAARLSKNKSQELESPGLRM